MYKYSYNGIQELYLERVTFEDEIDRTPLDDESIANNFANASKVDASEGKSNSREL